MDEIATLWKKFRHGDRGAYEALVETYLPMVKITADRLVVNLPRSVSSDELYSAGCVGLLLALDKFDPSREVKFETYALGRIRGAMLDELRNMDLASRLVRDKAKRIQRAEQEMAAQGIKLTPEGVAQHAGIPLEDYLDIELALRSIRLTSLDEPINTNNDLILPITGKTQPSPSDEAERKELREFIKAQLNERETLFITLYYYEELTLKEIGEIMDFTESRACQFHTEIIKRLEFKLRDWKYT